MTTTYVGGLSLAEAMPGIYLPIITVMGDLQARLTALLSFQIGITLPSIQADLDLSAKIIANLQASLTLGITPPSIDLQASIMLDVVLALKLQIGIILAMIDLLGAGVHVYTYDGQADAMGAGFSTELAGGPPGGSGTDHVNALVFLTAVPAVWLAIAQLFKTTP